MDNKSIGGYVTFSDEVLEQVPIIQSEDLASKQESAENGDATAQCELALYFQGEKKYDDAFFWMKKAADQGHWAAQVNLSRFYNKGLGVEQSDENCFYWALEAAKQGVDIAQHNVATMYSLGQGVCQDFNKAAEWYQKAIDQGYTNSMVDYGTMLMKEKGVEVDGSKILDLFTKAAELGNPDGQWNLGVAYYNGDLTTQDIKKAFHWVIKACKNGSSMSDQLLVDLLMRDDLTYTDKKDGVSELIEKANFSHDPNLEITIGLLYNVGVFFEKDYVKAAEWYKRAISHGQIKVGSNNLANLYHEGGFGLDQDYTEAFFYYMQAAELNVVGAQMQVGIMYSKGIGVERDLEQAKIWFLKVAEHGTLEDKINIGSEFFKGGLVEEDLEIAYKLFMEAAEQDYGKAQFNIGVMYQYGEGVEQDNEKAYQWFTKAKEQGIEKAEEKIKYLESILGNNKKESTENNGQDQSILFEEKYKSAFVYYEKAKKMLSNGEIEFALNSIRKSLELVVKKISLDCGMEYDTRVTDLITIIDRLHDTGMISDEVTSLMHKTRIQCNKGAHVDISGPDLLAEDAQQAIDNMGRILNALESIDNYNEKVRTNRIANNVPMVDPDYYNPSSRRYYGKWSNCYTAQSLMVNPEYVQLLNNAENGDIEAMLDLASGFLPKTIVWNENMVINMPKYHYKGREYYHPDSYDSRYYYWIGKAVQATISVYNGQRDGIIPWKYITTALYEEILFEAALYLADYTKNYISNIEERWDETTHKKILIPCYSNQYQLAERMFDSDFASSYSPFTETVEVLVDVLGKNLQSSIIAPVYRVSSYRAMKIAKYLFYCYRTKDNYEYYRLDDPTAPTYFPPKLSSLAIDPEDRNKQFDLELLQNYIDDDICAYFYNSLVLSDSMKQLIKERNQPKSAKGGGLFSAWKKRK